jgi:hypothetical protein
MPKTKTLPKTKPVAIEFGLKLRQPVWPYRIKLGIYLLIVSTCTVLFVMRSITIPEAQAQVVVPALLIGAPMAPPIGLQRFNPGAGNQNSFLPSVSGEAGTAIKDSLSGALEKLPLTAQRGLGDIFEKVSPLDRTPTQIGPNSVNPDSQTCNFMTGRCTETKNRLLPGGPTGGIGYDISSPDPLSVVVGKRGHVLIYANGYPVAEASSKWGLFEFKINNKTGLNGKPIPEKDRVKGSIIFDRLFYECSQIEEIDVIKGNWHRELPGFTTNIDAFERNLRNGMTMDEAMRNTFTGKVAEGQGFTKRTLDYYTPGEEASVYFQKPENK